MTVLRTSHIKHPQTTLTHQHVSVHKLRPDHQVTTVRQIIPTQLHCYLSTSAGIIFPSPAASMVDCQVLVEPGITKPKVNFHSKSVSECTPAGTFDAVAVEEHVLHHAQVVDHLLRGEIDLSRHRIALEDRCWDVGCHTLIFPIKDHAHLLVPLPQLLGCTRLSQVAQYSHVSGFPHQFPGVAIFHIHPITAIN